MTVIERLKDKSYTVKDLYAYTLHNKWYPILSSDRPIFDYSKKCIFCAHSVGMISIFLQGDLDFDVNCDTCVIDKKICSNYGIGGLVGEIRTLIDGEFGEILYLTVKEICDELEKHT